MGSCIPFTTFCLVLFLVYFSEFSCPKLTMIYSLHQKRLLLQNSKNQIKTLKIIGVGCQKRILSEYTSVKYRNRSRRCFHNVRNTLSSGDDDQGTNIRRNRNRK